MKVFILDTTSSKKYTLNILLMKFYKQFKNINSLTNVAETRKKGNWEKTKSLFVSFTFFLRDRKLFVYLDFEHENVKNRDGVNFRVPVGGSRSAAS